ncbi:hypothetical protein J3F83DRAFT_718280 [Trichoderma novae-zelandiae]
MPFTTRRRHHATATTTTTTPRPYRRSIFARRQPRVVHHQRKPTLKDKVSGVLTRLKGTLTGRPGVKAAGTRRMRGTDGRGSHRRRRFL